MGCTALYLVLLSLLAGSAYGESCTLITSNVLRMDSEETFIVDGHGTALNGHIKIQNFPKKTIIIAQGSISVNKDNGFLGISKFLIPSTKLDKDPEKKQFVYVNVRTDSCNLEKVVLVSYQSGYIFIQSDKSVYMPGSTVLYRIFSMNPDMKPINKLVEVDVLSPDNVIAMNYTLKQNNVKGIMSSSHKITKPASLGTWTMAAKFQDNPVHKFMTTFEVKEYVLPTFDVKLTPDKPFASTSDEKFIVNIQAQHPNGKKVDGVAHLQFLLSKDGEKKSLPETRQSLPIKDGEGSAVLRRQDLVKHFKEEADMLEWKLSASAKVISDSGGDVVEKELTDIPIVRFPYNVHFTKTSKYFIPGMPLDITACVTNPDGSPAQSVPVVAEPGAVRGVTQEDGTARLTINFNSDITSLVITVTTDVSLLPPTQQASASMTATAYQARGGNFLHLNTSSEPLKIGETAPINFIIRTADPTVQNQITHFNYMILNKGKIIKTGRQERAPGQSLVTLQLPITPELIPSFRTLAYYVITSGAGREMVADSSRMQVADTCTGTLTISGERDRDNAAQQPGASVKLTLNADHMASVALLARDKGDNVLNNKQRFSQRKVWDLVEKYDPGCTAGGGADAAGVFYDAGLAVINDFHGSTPQRSEQFCQEKVKRKQRKTGDLDFRDDANIFPRSDFQETLFWNAMTMTEKPQNGISSKNLNIFLKDSTTTWEFMAASMSEDKGICVSEPQNIQTIVPFFIDLKIPYSVIRNEQIDLRVILFNDQNSKP